MKETKECCPSCESPKGCIGDPRDFGKSSCPCHINECNHEHSSRVCNSCQVDLIQVAEQEMLNKVKAILTDELATAHTSESGRTSRLTSAYNRVSALRDNKE